MPELVDKAENLDKAGLVERVERRRRSILHPRTKRGKMWRLCAKYGLAVMAIGAFLVVGSQGHQANERQFSYLMGAEGNLNVSFINVLETKVVAQSAHAARLTTRGNATDMAESLATFFAMGGIADRPIVIIVASRGVEVYRVREGETVASIARSRGITEQTLRWANNMRRTVQVSVGQDLLVPAIDGVIYTWAAGDTVEAVARKYRGEVAEIIAYNELDNREVQVGERIFIPNGILPDNERPDFVPPLQTVIQARRGNTYARGHCTWYAYERRRELGLPVSNTWGHAATWAIRAQAQGFSVGTTPAVGAIIQNRGGPFGHVGIVERVYQDRIIISEMNFAGAWGRITTRTIPMDVADGSRNRANGQAPFFTFIY
jgi:surface antigen